jgi:uncharacterized protein YqeY
MDARHNRSDAGSVMKARLRADLRAALKARATGEAALLRALVAAIDNAEAPPPEAGRRSVDVHDFHSGSAEVARLELAGEQLRALFVAEIAEREIAAAQLASGGRGDRARMLLDEIDIVRRYLVRND